MADYDFPVDCLSFNISFGGKDWGHRGRLCDLFEYFRDYVCAIHACNRLAQTDRKVHCGKIAKYPSGYFLLINLNRHAIILGL